jgi:hypothetical protein
MNMRKFGTSIAEIDSTKIILDDEKELVVPAVLAREAVLRYPSGKSFRPATELKNSMLTFATWVVTGKHPPYMILTNPADVKGHTGSIQWDEAIPLPDGKGTTPGVRGQVHFLKDRCDPAFLEEVRTHKRKDVSIGFLSQDVLEPGEYKGEKYDFVQKNIMVNHVAAGVALGRGTRDGFPCEISVDAVFLPEDVQAHADPWEETEDSIRSGHGDASQAETCRTTDFDGKLPKGIKAVYCKRKDSDEWYVQSYIFPKSEGWTMASAKEWFSSHNDAITKAWGDMAAAAGNGEQKPLDEGAEQNPPPPPPPTLDPAKEVERAKNVLQKRKNLR